MKSKLHLIIPFPNQKPTGGTKIRLEGLKKYFQSQFSISLINSKNQFKQIKPKDKVLILLSSKKNSLSYHWSLNKKCFTLIDLYNPLPLEKKAAIPKNLLYPIKLWQMSSVWRKILNIGDQFLVANPYQKEYWQKYSPRVIPTGAPLIKLIKLSFKPLTLLWFGGLYPWYDLESIIKIFPQLIKKIPNLRLRLIGVQHPQTKYQSAVKIKQLISQLNLNKNIDWISWQKENQLRQSLQNVSSAVHWVKHTPEDRYAHRVRLLTLTNAGIPVITNGSDFISQLIVKNKAGWFIKDPNKITGLLIPSKIRQASKQSSKIQPQYLSVK